MRSACRGEGEKHSVGTINRRFNSVDFGDYMGKECRNGAISTEMKASTKNKNGLGVETGKKRADFFLYLPPSKRHKKRRQSK